MWKVTNTTPFPAQSGFVRDEHGQSFWTVWLKGTFALRSGQLPVFIAGGQGEPARGPVYRDDDPAGVMVADSDLVPRKPKVDVLIRARAAAEDTGTPRQIRFAIGSWHKALTLHPPRRWSTRGVAKPDMDIPIAAVDLDWRVAAGGPDNPLGMEDSPPLLAYRDGDRARRKDPPAPPAGLGPIPPHWPPRADHAGTYDSEWEETRAPILPHDFTPAAWQCAPRDQQIDASALSGQSLIVEGLDGISQGTDFPLPEIDFQIETLQGPTWVAQISLLQTLTIDLIAGTASVLYSSRLRLPRAADDVNIRETMVNLGTNSRFRVNKSDLAIFRLPVREAS